MDDLISRQAAIATAISGRVRTQDGEDWIRVSEVRESLYAAPSAEPTLYGYKIEHLAYIARVMEKEGVTADYAVRTFDDMSRAIKMIIDETQQKVEEALNGRFNQQTGCD